MTLAELAEVTEVERLALRPGDVLVVKYPHRLTAAEQIWVKEQLDRVWPERHVKVLICDGGMDVAVLRAEDTDSAESAVARVRAILDPSAWDRDLDIIAALNGAVA